MPICMHQQKRHFLNCLEQVVQQMGPDTFTSRIKYWAHIFHGRSRAECHLRGTACSMSSVARKTDVSQTSENAKGFERPVGKAGQSCVFFFGHSPITLGWTRDPFSRIRKQPKLRGLDRRVQCHMWAFWNALCLKPPGTGSEQQGLRIWFEWTLALSPVV